MELTFGVEIETIQLSREKAARVIQGVVGGTVSYTRDTYETWVCKAPDGRVWKAMRDGSLSCSVHAEVVTPILKGDADLATLQLIVRALRAAGAKVDGSCGIHVHVGANAFTPKALQNLTKMMHKYEDLIYPAVGILSERMRWAAKVNPSFLQQIESKKAITLDELNVAWYGHRNTTPYHYDQSRYHGLNLHNVWFRGTVEFRLFNSTLHAGKVKAYVQFCLALATKAIESKTLQSDKRTFDPAHAKYDFRVFLLNLGMKGDEFATARLHLLANFSGSGSYRGVRAA